MADEQRDGADVMRQVFGERERLAHQTGHALALSTCCSIQALRGVAYSPYENRHAS
jgi:hypothetical protein